MGFIIWDKTSNVTLPNGTEYTPEEIVKEYPFMKTLPCVLEMQGPVAVGIDRLYVLMSRFGIDPSASDSEKLAAISEGFERDRNPIPVDNPGLDEALAILRGEVEVEA